MPVIPGIVYSVCYRDVVRIVGIVDGVAIVFVVVVGVVVIVVVVVPVWGVWRCGRRYGPIHVQGVVIVGRCYYRCCILGFRRVL